MGFSIDRRAHKPKGLFRKAPDVQEIGDRLARLVKRIEKKNVVRLARKQGQVLAELELHPGALPIRLTLDAEAVLAVRGDTGSVGPGYHADVIARVERILEEIDYRWVDTESDVQGAMCTWLASELARDGQIKIGVPADRVFLCDASVMTALGPRDAAWRARVIANPRDGADAFPWWKRGAAYAARARALRAMWFEIPWREPIYPDERELLERVDADLREARAGDAEIDLPYPEWAQVLDFLEIDDDHTTAIRKRAGDRESTIGYRRLDMDVELSGGWSIHLPGSFTGLWIDDGARYWASDGDRIVELTTFTADGETDSERLLAVAPPQHPVIDQLADGTRRGRAEVHDEADVHIVTGLVACAPHVAILTFKVTRKDQPWALATWRSLRQES